MNYVIERARISEAWFRARYTQPEGKLRDLDAANTIRDLIAMLEADAKQEPVAQQPLTDEQIDSFVARSCKKDSSHLDAARVARAIEAAHGIGGKHD